MGNSLEITDRDGWKKDFPLSKTILHIGSDPRNDIILDPNRGGGVAHRHLQLVLPAAEGAGAHCRIVNLADAEVLLGDRRLASHASTQLSGGEVIRVGDFTLVLKLIARTAAAAAGQTAPVVAAVVQASEGVGAESIGIGLSLPSTRLAPQQPLNGTVVVRNLGNQVGVQFKVELEGLEADNYTLGPGPILFPNASKEIPLHLVHPQRPVPATGPHTITLRATAPEAYPGQEATVSQTIDILPYYRHNLRLIVAGA